MINMFHLNTYFKQDYVLTATLKYHSVQNFHCFLDSQFLVFRIIVFNYFFIYSVMTNGFKVSTIIFLKGREEKDFRPKLYIH